MKIERTFGFESPVLRLCKPHSYAVFLFFLFPGVTLEKYYKKKRKATVAFFKKGDTVSGCGAQRSRKEGF